jgi:type II secretory pathway component PulM
MSQRSPNQFSEKLVTFLKKAKELLSKDYSIQDLKNLKSLPKTLKDKLSEVQGGLSKTSASSGMITSSTTQFDIQKLPLLVREFVIQQRSVFILLLLILILLLLNNFVIAPYNQKVQDQLDMRPAQWSQLQSLIKIAKSSSPTASQSPAYGSGGVATVTLLDDMELQKIRGVLTSRGLKPNVLRLTADNPPRIEFQASDAMFSVLLEALDELRATWRLYPEQLNIVSTTGAGVVNISGVLVQHGGQAGMTR